VSDPVFSEKVLGDVCTILPVDGKIYSHEDGKISFVAEMLHAYPIPSKDGMELLVRFGLEDFALKIEKFTSHVQVGNKVKVGELIAEVQRCCSIR